VALFGQVDRHRTLVRRTEGECENRPDEDQPGNDEQDLEDVEDAALLTRSILGVGAAVPHPVSDIGRPGNDHDHDPTQPEEEHEDAEETKADPEQLAHQATLLEAKRSRAPFDEGFDVDGFMSIGS
jgi:hypothetical protein